MIFLGDVAIPNYEIADSLDKPKCFGEDVIIVNLEGTISSDSQKNS